MVRKILFWMLAALFSAGSVVGQTSQSHQHSAAEPHQRNCGTQLMLERRLREDPSLAQRLAEQEQRLQLAIANRPALKTTEIYNIQIVVHVVLPNPNLVTDAQIQSQINTLNTDFAAANPDLTTVPIEFRNVSADTELRFCLATTDPYGNPTNGIIRKSRPGSYSLNEADDAKHDHLGGSSAWNTSQYLNIWVIDIEGGILGYAYLPGTAQPDDDGVVVVYRYFGTGGSVSSADYDLGRTCVHEVGHYLNLEHVWGDAFCGDDNVSDTPTQEAPNYGCPIHPSPSCGNNGDMFMNYMDYGDDDCLRMFSQGQKTRMRAAIDYYRPGLISQSPCAAPPPNPCAGGVTLLAPSGFVADGSEASNYANGLECSWLIAPPVASTVYLNFTEFDTEQDYDFVRIYDGSSITSPLIGEFSGPTLPAGTFTANSGSALVRFTTDNTITERGWRLNYWMDGMVGEAEPNGPAEFLVYPNPTNGIITLQGTLPVAQAIAYRVMNMQGQTVVPTKSIGLVQQFAENADIGHLGAGLYAVQLFAGAEVHTVKVLVR